MALELGMQMTSITSDGVKHDKDKPDLSHVTYELVEQVAKVRMFGAKKYERNNWRKGFKITRSLAAALRHLFLFLGGEDNDKESGLNHLGHAMCCIEHALHDYLYRKHNDDRYKTETATDVSVMCTGVDVGTVDKK